MKKVIHGKKKNGHGRLGSTFLIAEVANNTQHPYLVLLFSNYYCNPERENRRMNENIIFYPK